VRLRRQVPSCGRDVGALEEAQQADRDMAETGQHTRRLARARTTAILVNGHVTDMVPAVLDSPMSPVERQERAERASVRLRLLSRETRSRGVVARRT
jgi:hypothetical protein